MRDERRRELATGETPGPGQAPSLSRAQPHTLRLPAPRGCRKGSVKDRVAAPRGRGRWAALRQALLCVSPGTRKAPPGSAASARGPLRLLSSPRRWLCASVGGRGKEELTQGSPACSEGRRQGRSQRGTAGVWGDTGKGQGPSRRPYGMGGRGGGDGLSEPFSRKLAEGPRGLKNSWCLMRRRGSTRTGEGERGPEGGWLLGRAQLCPLPSG